MEKITKEGPERTKEVECFMKAMKIDADGREACVCFATWLNLYFEPWNPDDGTWIDADNFAYTAADLFDEFEKEVKILQKTP